MIKNALLEVTKIEPRYKHSTIFDHFDALENGESFIILNDHDPKPLYYQLINERGTNLIWDYIQSGPEYWQVRIGKPKESLEKETIGNIAAKDIRKATLLKQLGIDFCCGGKQTLEDAAESIGISAIELKSKLDETNKSTKGSVDFDFSSWDLDFLSDYIKNVHHKYIKEKSPIIQQLAEKVATVHANQHPELEKLSKELNVFLFDLNNHIEKEEKQLFPVTKNHNSLTNEQTNQLISYLSLEHENTGEELKQLKLNTNNFTPPTNACNSYIYLFEELKAFEEDLLQHIHLENNILFPKLLQAFEMNPTFN